MITGAIKNKVDKIWTDIWAGGITNPLTVIEQLTYLMFIRSLDEKELETEAFEQMSGEKMQKIFPQSPIGQSMRWSKFKNNDPRDIYDVISQRVFPAIKNMKHGRLPDFTEQGELEEIADGGAADGEESAFARYMSDAMFLIPTPQVLQKIITGLDDLYEHDISDLDMQGDLYEYMLGKLSTAGQNGQFRTPRHIIKMMVELLQPTPEDAICDPACGTAGFLVAAAEYIRAHYEDAMTSEQWEHFSGPMFTGFDTDRTMLRLSAMNLMLHSITHPEIDYQDSVSKQNQIRDRYTICLANPPFKGTIDAESINDNLKAVTNTKKTEDRAAVPGAVSADAEKRRAMRLHRAGRRAVRFFQRAQGDPQGVGRKPPAAGSDFHAFRRVQTLCGRFYGGAGVYQNRSRRHGQRVVL